MNQVDILKSNLQYWGEELQRPYIKETRRIELLNKINEADQKLIALMYGVPKIPQPVHKPSHNNHQDIYNKIFTEHSAAFICGFLNLRDQDGWKEGGPTTIGALFIRHLFENYKNKLSDFDREVLVNVLSGFSSLGVLKKDIIECLPKKNRICFDAGIKGWKDHAVSRMVGNVGPSYDPANPFFEIAINSQHKTPFFVTLYGNEKELDEHREFLISLDKTPQDLANECFFSPHQKTIDHYLKGHKPTREENHLIEGLKYLKNKALPPQTTGNCWLIQPMRAMLAALYIEYYTTLGAITPDEGWNLAHKTYRHVLDTEGMDMIAKLLNFTVTTDKMRNIALEKINANNHTS